MKMHTCMNPITIRQQPDIMVGIRITITGSIAPLFWFWDIELVRIEEK